MKSHAAAYNITFDATEDHTLFNTHNLAKYDAVLFLSTSDSQNGTTPRIEVLDDAGKVLVFSPFVSMFSESGG